MKSLVRILLALLFLLFATGSVKAVETMKMGVHILRTDELPAAKEMIAVDGSDQWQYVTIPFTSADSDKKDEWQAFFELAKEKKIIPLVRLATKVENGVWTVPDRKDITRQIAVLSSLTWPTDQRHIIVFNEVNHAKEWGGHLDPAEYASILAFTKNWANTENKNYVVLPAAMDLAAPNSGATREAFSYLSAMYSEDSEIFNGLGGWNSHSYPNPAFSAAPTKIGKNSLRGYEHELAFLKGKTTTDLPVYITETGWEDSRVTSRWLTSYYQYAMQHIWSDPRVVAVTPFVLRGAPGPFAGFSFLTGEGKPTHQYTAFKTALHQVFGKKTASVE